MSHDKKAIILDAFRQGCTVGQAAQAAGISSKTIYRWAADDTAFKDAVEEARDKADDMVEAVTYANATDPDPAHNTLRMFWLKSRRPEVYADRLRQEIAGKDGQPILGVMVYIPHNGRDDQPPDPLHPAQ